MRQLPLWSGPKPRSGLEIVSSPVKSWMKFWITALLIAIAAGPARAANAARALADPVTSAHPVTVADALTLGYSQTLASPETLVIRWRQVIR